ncbi:MAG: hypothetical protein IPJ02_08590 [Chitinophagaceae bacterium]|nr:hypothetical protein [Chitinophagaceae bacterium]
MEGLVSADRFHSRQPISYSVAEQLLEMPRLKVIQFHDIKPDKTTLNILNDVIFKRRKDITLRVYGYPDTWADISFLNLLPDLERFDWDTAVFGSYEPLYKLNRLIHLGLGFTQPKPKISLKFIADFKDTLESLNLEGDYKDLLTTIPQLENLKTIWLVSTKLKGFDFLQGLPLETIGNYGGRVESFEFLPKIQSLKKLWIKTNSKIENIDFIEHLPNLEDIELQYVAKVTRFPQCNHLKHLKRIFAFECNRLEDISEVKKLNNCEIFLSGNKLKGRHYKVELTK